MYQKDPQSVWSKQYQCKTIPKIVLYDLPQLFFAKLGRKYTFLSSYTFFLYIHYQHHRKQHQKIFEIHVPILPHGCVHSS